MIPNVKLITIPTIAMAQVLSKIVRKSKMDCWCFVDTDSRKIYDNEDGFKQLHIRGALMDIIGGLDCPENWSNLQLTNEEEATFMELLNYYKVSFSIPTQA